MIGCPAANLEGSAPADAQLVKRDEKTFDLVLPEALLPDGYSPDLMQKEFEAWKQSLPEPKESNSRKRQQAVVSSSPPISAPPPVRLTDIMRDIVPQVRRFLKDELALTLLPHAGSNQAILQLNG